MATKFPLQVYAVMEGNGQVGFYTDLAKAATPTGRELAIYAFQNIRVCRLVAEWKPDPAPEPVPPSPIREELS